MNGITNCMTALCCFKTPTKKDSHSGLPPAYSETTSTANTGKLVKKTGNSIVINLETKPDALKPEYADYLKGIFPPYINATRRQSDYADKVDFFNTLLSKLNGTNLNNAEKKAILSLLYTKLTGVNSVPEKKPEGRLLGRLWEAINELKSDYEPFSVTINLGYSGQGNNFPFHLLTAENINQQSGDSIGTIDETSLFDLEVYMLAVNPYAGENHDHTLNDTVNFVKECGAFKETNKLAFGQHLARNITQ